METKSLLYGLTGLIIGGLVVSVAATTMNQSTISSTMSNDSDMTMSQMSASLENKSGDDFDKAFITEMIEHHEGAVSMAKLSVKNAKHAEIKKLSNDIISAQEKEITQMKQWQADWGYGSTGDTMNHSMR